MKKIKILMFLILVSTSFIVSAQNKYKLTKKRTTKILSKFEGTYTVYNVKDGVVNIPIYDTLCIPNKDRMKIINSLKVLSKDSIIISKKRIEIKRMVQLLDNYIHSHEKYRKKKIFLKEAQSLASKNNIHDLIFANLSRNTDRLSYFITLRSNADKLIRHLNNVKNKISDKYLNNQLRVNKEIENLKDKLLYIPKKKSTIKKNGVMKKKVYFYDNKVDSVENIVGVFISVGNYYVVNKDFKNYVYGQLVSEIEYIEESLPYSYFSKSKTLIKEINSNKLYLCRHDFLKNIGFNINEEKIISKLKKHGFKSFKEGEYIIVNDNNTKIKLTPDVYSNIEKGNYQYVRKLSNSIKIFYATVAKTKEVNSQLIKSFSAHQHGLLTYVRLNKWKKQIAYAEKLFSKIKKLPCMGSDNFYNYTLQLDTKILNQYNEFINIFKGSKRVLGI